LAFKEGLQIAALLMGG